VDTDDGPYHALRVVGSESELAALIALQSRVFAAFAHLIASIAGVSWAALLIAEWRLCTDRPIARAQPGPLSARTDKLPPTLTGLAALLAEEDDAPILRIGDGVFPLMPDDSWLCLVDLLELHRVTPVLDFVEPDRLDELLAPEDQLGLTLPPHLKLGGLDRDTHGNGHDGDDHQEHDQGVTGFPPAPMPASGVS